MPTFHLNSSWNDPSFLGPAGAGSNFMCCHHSCRQGFCSPNMFACKHLANKTCSLRRKHFFPCLHACIANATCLHLFACLRANLFATPFALFSSKCKRVCVARTQACSQLARLFDPEVLACLHANKFGEQKPCRQLAMHDACSTIFH